MSTAAEDLETEPIVLREDRDDGITTLTLNRPDKYNALSEDLLTAMQERIEELKQDESVRVVILAANGKAFSAGHDLREMRSKHGQEYYNRLFRQCSGVMLGLLSLPQPVIARVHGMATAAGCQLVANCDLAVASTEAKLAVSGVNLGLFCSTPGVALSRNVPRKRAFEMLITGEFIDAQTAADWGLVNRAVAPEDLDEEVMSLAANIAAKTPVAVRTGKRLFYEQIVKDLPEAYDHAAGVMACNMMEEDTVEGVDAFLEKRKPSWARQ
ncbi:MAG: enoyl-CoA hydratase [Gammaproteobacteria bacterium]|nr:enoyl-CoA hydratase [Gammaproteobacteria bacterium]